MPLDRLVQLHRKHAVFPAADPAADAVLTAKQPPVPMTSGLANFATLQTSRSFVLLVALLTLVRDAANLDRLCVQCKGIRLLSATLVLALAAGVAH